MEDKQLPSFSWFKKTKSSELVEVATMVNWHHCSSLDSITYMWYALREWIQTLRGRFLPYNLKKTIKVVP